MISASYKMINLKMLFYIIFVMNTEHKHAH